MDIYDTVNGYELVAGTIRSNLEGLKSELKNVNYKDKLDSKYWRSIDDAMKLLYQLSFLPTEAEIDNESKNTYKELISTGNRLVKRLVENYADDEDDAKDLLSTELFPIRQEERFGFISIVFDFKPFHKYKASTTSPSYYKELIEASFEHSIAECHELINAAYIVYEFYFKEKQYIRDCDNSDVKVMTDLI